MRYVRLPSVAMLAFCGWFAAGCVNDENGLAIVHFVALTPANMCVADPASLVLDGQGQLDVFTASISGTGFILAPVVVNNLVINTSTTSPVNTIFVEGFDVELTPDPADAAISAALPAAQRKFRIPAAGGAIFPGGGGMAMTSSEVAVPIEVINGDVAKLLAQAVPAGTRDPLALTVRLRPVGTHSGVTINGGWVNFPVFVCNGCLIQDIGACPAGGVDPATIRQTCNPSQDLTTCCESGTQLLCGSAVPRKP